MAYIGDLYGEARLAEIQRVLEARELAIELLRRHVKDGSRDLVRAWIIAGPSPDDDETRNVEYMMRLASHELNTIPPAAVRRIGDLEAEVDRLRTELVESKQKQQLDERREPAQKTALNPESLRNFEATMGEAMRALGDVGKQLSGEPT